MKNLELKRITFIDVLWYFFAILLVGLFVSQIEQITEWGVGILSNYGISSISIPTSTEKLMELVILIINSIIVCMPLRLLIKLDYY